MAVQAALLSHLVVPKQSHYWCYSNLFSSVISDTPITQKSGEKIRNFFPLLRFASQKLLFTW